MKNCVRQYFVDLNEVNIFALLRSFCISHIIVKKLNFQFSIVFSEIKLKIIHLLKKYGDSNL